ncbi:37S ribosomal mrp21 [Lecanosticta acicola]|uniref:37S ribosomal mrp21 n=1 Tax=Lecanosticta acicola TaxID=111012 RepID=A0AAI8Z297_9PEZI|nr:37S ribosomal mrp21 [Lecanosticta acicola]
MDVDRILSGYDKSARAEQIKQYQEPKAMKLGPTVGRTVEVNLERNMDIGRAFRQLEMTCARNNVRKDMMKQRFHERPGMRRKRLKSERWRKNFRKNFSGVVQLVQKMKRQGW